MTEEEIREDLAEPGRQLLRLIVRHIEAPELVPGQPETYLGYKDCCVNLGLAPAHADVPWGRLLQKHGLNDLNDWTMRHNLPRVTGLIVNQGGERQYLPGGDFFSSNGRPDMDGQWWEEQARLAEAFDWDPYL